MQIRNRAIRLFVSSTFNDMHEERDMLCRFVFPVLEDYCSRRNIGFTGIDLRWGVTEEEVRQGKTVGLCLTEIDHCRPYFLGILGERYGWIPDRKLTGTYAPLFRGRRSITEAEIMYGALEKGNTPTPQAFFCLRHPDLTRRLTGDTVEPPNSRQRLRRLKNSIRKSPFPVLDGYTSITAFASFICEQVCLAIDRDFPLGEALDEYRQESVAHIYYARNQNDVFTGRDRQLADVDAFFATDNGTSLFVTGAPGAGKTAFLARWAIRRYESDPNSFVFMHFYGASLRSAQWQSLARRLIHALCKRFNLPFQLPATSGELTAAMQNYLHLAAQQGADILLVLDGIDLVNTDKSIGMAWLPEDLPCGVKMLLSVKTADGRAMMLRRGYREYRLPTLQPDEQQSLVRKRLMPYAKKLETCHMERIMCSSAARNPLYLRVLLHELCTRSTHDRMDKLLTYYLDAQSVEALFGKVIDMCGETYNQEMTREMLALLRCARHGLTERELRALLGVPAAVFSPLYLALKPYLINRNGVLNFAFTALRDAAGRSCLASSQGKMAIRRRLADSFMKKRTSRMIEELPWLLEKTAAWSRLYHLLRDTDNFHRLWEHNPSEVKIYWKKIETQTKKNRVTAYAQTEAQRRRTSLQIRLELATFFFETGYPAEAEHRLLSLCNIHPTRKNRDMRQQAFGLMGNLCFASGRYGDAKAYYRRKMAICRKDGNRLELSRALGNLGVMAETTGNYEDALACYEQAGQECRELGFVHGIQAESGNRGNVYMKIKKFDKAAALFDAQEQVCRESGHIPGLVAALGNKGFLMLERGDNAEALRLFDEQETLCKKINDLNQLQIIYGNRAVALYRQRRIPEALQWLEKQLDVSRQAGNFDGQQKALERLAILKFDGGEHAEALQLCSRRVALCRRHRARIPCAESLRQYAVALKACGRDAEAQDALREAEILK